MSADYRNPRRFFMLIMLLLVPFCAMLPYIAPSIFLQDMVDSFGAEMGIISLGMTLQLTMTGLCMFFGTFVQDRLGARRTIILGLALMAAGSYLTFAAPGLGVYLAARIIGGVGQGLYSVSNLSFNSEWFAGKERMYTIAFVTMATSAAMGLSYLINRPLCILLGSWQRAFLMYAVMITAVLILWIFAARDGVREMTVTGGAGGRKSSLLLAAKDPQYWKLMVVALTGGLVTSAINAFLPVYLTESRGMPEAAAALIAALNAFFGVAGSFLGAFLCSRIRRRKITLFFSTLLYFGLSLCITLVPGMTATAVCALAAGAVYFAMLTILTNVLAESNTTGDVNIYSGGNTIVNGTTQLFGILASVLFSAASAAWSMDIAFRVIFSVLIAGAAAALVIRETGTRQAESK